MLLISLRFLSRSIISVFILFSLILTSQAAIFNPANVTELISAIQTANSNNQDDQINLVPNMIYTITGSEPGVPFTGFIGDNGLPVILSDNGNNLTINGNGATIERSAALFTDPSDPCSGVGIQFRIFDVDSGAELILNSIRLRNGCAPDGGAIFSFPEDSIITITQGVITNNATTVTGGGIITRGALNLTNTQVTKNKAQNASGGGLAVFGNVGTLTMIDSNVSNNIAQGAAGIFLNEATAVIMGSTISNNIATLGDGGGIACFLGSLTIGGSTITGNMASGALGGGIFSAGSPVSIDQTTITNNQAFLDGGGTAHIGAFPVTITNSNISDNVAMNTGGGIASSQATLEVSNTTILRNEANSTGGGLLVLEGPLTITDSVVSDNVSVTDQGGGIIGNGDLTITNTHVTDNSAGLGSGGIGIFGPNTVTMTDSVVSGNTAFSNAGVLILGPTAFITGSTIIDNTSDQGNGGGIGSAVGDLTIENSTISHNRILDPVFSRGGGISKIDGSLNIDNTVISYNEIQRDGGGISLDGGASAVISYSKINNNITHADFGGGISSAPGGSLQITNTMISENEAELGGGGIRVDSGSLFLDSSTVSDNIGVNGGGGIVNTNSDLEIINSTISGNHTDLIGGGMINSGGSLLLTFSTVANNTANQAGGGFSISGFNAEVKNTIVAGNTSPTDSNCLGLSVGAMVNDNGGNISDDNTDLCASFFNADFNTATMLGPLGNNGGVGDTHALIPTVAPLNPALDSILIADCTDQQPMPAAVTNDGRGFVRPFPAIGNCDSGAFELQPVGSLSVLKETIPEGLRNIDFTGINFPKACFMDSFILDDAELATCVVDSAQTLTVFENAPQPFTLNASCSGASSWRPVVGGLGGVSVDLGLNEDVTCTFTNTALPLNLVGILPQLSRANNFILFDGAQPEEEVAIFWGFKPGSETLEDGDCEGATVNIINPRLLDIVPADENGEINYEVFVPIRATDRTVVIQGITTDNCRVSNLGSATFRNDN